MADAPRRGYRGEHMGNAPFGYHRRRDGRLALDAGTGPIVTELFRRRAKGATIGERRAYLRQEAIPLPLERHTQPADYASIVSVRPWMGQPTSMRRCASWTTRAAPTTRGCSPDAFRADGGAADEGPRSVA